MCEKSGDRRPERGFALILALLALLLLTFLGLTLATTTSTEMRIATNYRWSTQALYNADAGLESAKAILQTLNWTALLPPARPAWTPPTTASLPSNPTVGLGGTRNWEMGACDSLGRGVGYGVVLFDGTTPYENITTVPGFAGAPPLNGAFTLWIRRPVVPTAVAGQYQDDATNNDTMVLTIEGVAPYTAAATASNALAQANQARRVIEVTVRRQAQPAPCDMRSGQIGGGPEGNNIFGGSCGGTVADAASNLTFAPGNRTRITPP